MAEDVERRWPMSGTWNSGGNLGTAREELAGGGNGDDAICMGGTNGSYSMLTTTEEYGGTSWSSGGALGTARTGSGGDGNSVNAIIVSGDSDSGPLDDTSEYNGSAWESGGATSIARRYTSAAGNASGAIAATGFFYDEETEESIFYDLTEEYDGTAWTTSNSLSYGRYGNGLSGSASAAIAMSGNVPVGLTYSTEEYNGTSWADGGDIVACREGLASAGNPTTALCMGGYNSSWAPLATCEVYDGSAWASDTSMSNARGYLAGGGSATAAIAMGGNYYGMSNITEEWTNSTSSAYLGRGFCEGIFHGVMD
jgi:hypothetical protein